MGSSSCDLHQQRWPQLTSSISILVSDIMVLVVSMESMVSIMAMEVTIIIIILIQLRSVVSPSTAPNLSFITSISKSFVWTNVHCFCNISVNSIDLLPVFIGIFKIRDVADQFEEETVLSITVLMSIVPNTMKLREFAQTETSARTFIERQVTQKIGDFASKTDPTVHSPTAPTISDPPSMTSGNCKPLRMARRTR